MGVPIPPNNSSLSREYTYNTPSAQNRQPGSAVVKAALTIHGRHIRRQYRSHEDVAADHELAVHAEELWLVRKLPEKRTDRRSAKRRSIREQ